MVGNLTVTLRILSGDVGNPEYWSAERMAYWWGQALVMLTGHAKRQTQFRLLDAFARNPNRLLLLLESAELAAHVKDATDSIEAWRKRQGLPPKAR